MASSSQQSAGAIMQIKVSKTKEKEAIKKLNKLLKIIQKNTKPIKVVHCFNKKTKGN